MLYFLLYPIQSYLKKCHKYSSFGKILGKSHFLFQLGKSASTSFHNFVVRNLAQIVKRHILASNVQKFLMEMRFREVYMVLNDQMIITNLYSAPSVKRTFRANGFLRITDSFHVSNYIRTSYKMTSI